MPPQLPIDPQDSQAQAEQAASQGNWKAAADLYARCVEQRLSELALIHSVQQGLSSRLAMQDIYDLVGDKLRDTFNAQVVMISQYDPLTQKIFHHYAIESGQHLRIGDADTNCLAQGDQSHHVILQDQHTKRFQSMSCVCRDPDFLQPDCAQTRQPRARVTSRPIHAKTLLTLRPLQSKPHAMVQSLRACS